MKYISLLLFFLGTLNLNAQTNNKTKDSIIETKTQIVDVPKVFYVVEQMPQYPGGESELHKFIAKNIHYPKMELDSNIQGRVIVGFTVYEDGSVNDVTVKRSVSPGLDAEAVRVLSLLHFNPGMQNGKAVRVYYVLPIMFKL